MHACLAIPRDQRRSHVGRSEISDDPPDQSHGKSVGDPNSRSVFFVRLKGFRRRCA